MSTTQIIGFLIVILALWAAWRPAQARSGDPLSRVLVNWANTPFTLRNLCGSVLCFGQSGSGKTSGPGRFFLHLVMNIPFSGGLIITSKPEEREAILRAARFTGRDKDLIFFGPNETARFNFLEQLGGDTQRLSGNVFSS